MTTGSGFSLRWYSSFFPKYKKRASFSELASGPGTPERKKESCLAGILRAGTGQAGGPRTRRMVTAISLRENGFQRKALIPMAAACPSVSPSL